MPDDPQCTYVWSISPASRGLITGGQGSGTVTINWNTSGPATVSTTGTNGITTCVSSTSYPLEIHPKPQPVFTPCFELVTTPGSKKFTLTGATPYINGQSLFSGTRVFYNSSTGAYEFNPYGALTGIYPVTYTFTNNFGCTASTNPVSILVQNSSFSCGGEMTDIRDGKKYMTAMLGGRCWMSENLKYGTTLSSPGPAQTNNCLVEKYCAPDDPGCSKNGGLYQWDEVIQYNDYFELKGVCPPEWHVPTEAEWQSLIDNVLSGVGAPIANAVTGGILKDQVSYGGFNALLGGLDYGNYFWSFYTGSNKGTMYWSSTPSDPMRSIARGLNIFTPSVSKYYSRKDNAFSVRCIKD